MKKAILWPYKFDNMKQSWKLQMQWVVKALQDEGYTVVRCPRFKCEGIYHLPTYNYKTDNPCDIVIYNHTDVSHLVGNEVKAKYNWFFKPTIPDKYHTTLDNLGYSAYSSITYNKPPFEQCDMKEVNKFFDTKVKNWIEQKATKFYNFDNKEIEIKEKDYYLVLGQCGGDYTVTHQDFGYYFYRLETVVRELIRVTKEPIVVKLHPYTDGEFATKTEFSDKIGERLSLIHPRVAVYTGKCNIHSFIKDAKAVLLSNSGSGFEVGMHLKPIIAWGYPEYHWISYDLKHLCDIKRALKLDWFDKEKEKKFIYWYFEKYTFWNLESCKKRVKELLNV